MSDPTMELADLEGFWITNPDGYMALEYYPDPDDDTCGEMVMYVDAGDELMELVKKALEFKQNRDKP